MPRTAFEVPVTLTARIALLVTAVLVLNTALVLVISKDRARSAFRNQARASLDTALGAAETGVTEMSDDLAASVEAVTHTESFVATLEDAAAGRIDRQSGAVVRSADRARLPHALDLLRVLDARGVVLSSSPDPERFGTTDRTLAALATLSTERTEVRDVALGDDRATMILHARRTGAGLVIVGGRVLDEALARTLSRQVGAPVFLRIPKGDWAVLSGRAPEVPARADTQHVGERLRIEGPDVAAGQVGVLGDRLELLVVREDATLGELEARLTRSVLAIGAVTLLASWLVAFLLSRAIGRPLTALTHATLRVAAGDWDHRVREMGGASEFGSLVAAFNAMQEQLARQRSALRHAARQAAWQDAARRVAHEIKNTLTPLQLAWERLRGEGRTPNVNESADAIAGEITNLRRLVTEFSELGRWPEPERRRVDLSHIARSTAEVYGAPVTTMLADAGVALVAADAGQLARALSNLVQNALDAAGAEGKVVVRTWRDAKGVALSVSDDGPGMDEETVTQAFTPYFTRKPTGTGLGLSIVERIAGANGAECELESRPGEGTVVTLRFPALTRGSS